jgi:hypothetical protein
MYGRHARLGLRFTDDDRFWSRSKEVTFQQLGRSGPLRMVDLECTVEKVKRLGRDIGWDGWDVCLADLILSASALASKGKDRAHPEDRLHLGKVRPRMCSRQHLDDQASDRPDIRF